MFFNSDIVLKTDWGRDRRSFLWPTEIASYRSWFYSRMEDVG